MMLDHLLGLLHVAPYVILFTLTLEFASQLLILDAYLEHLRVKLHGCILDIERAIG